MSNYEYSSYVSSSPTIVSAGSASGNAGAGGFDASKAIFKQVDTNQDGTIDRNEFQQWAGSAGGAGGAGGAGQFDLSAAGGAGGSFGSSVYQVSNYSSGGGAGGAYGIDAGLAGAGGISSFESSSGFASDVGFDAGAAGGSTLQSSTFESTTTGGGFDATAINQAAGYTAETNAAWSQYGAEVRGAGLYVDANPQIIRRQAAGVQTYTQNIRVRFLQPPPIPPPGPLIIKEVRPPQPPPPPPLRIRQRAPPLPQPPPLILRERPPQPPASQAAQTVIRKLAAIPVPPRSVIIERIPAAPPRPRDIIIERWIPYGAAAKRKTIVQRAAVAKGYERPRNIIIQYEPVQVRIVRQFVRLGVTQESPQAYVQRYGAQLLDAQTLLQQARAVGVIEDISPPAGAAGLSVSSSSFSQDASFGASGVGAELTGVAGGEFGGASSSFSSGSYENSQFGGAGGLVGVGFNSGLVEGAGAGGGYGSSNFESSVYSSNAGGGAGGFGIDAGFASGAGGGLSSSSYDSSSFSLGGAGGAGGAGGGNSSSSYESSSFGIGGAGGAGGFDAVGAAFNSADRNRDGAVDAKEFKQFFQGGL